MALGTFSGGGLGFGAVFRLENQFSGTAREIQRDMAGLEGSVDRMALRVERSMQGMKAGIATIGLGAALVAPFALGVGAASDYEENMNKLEVAFGKYADNVRSFTDNALSDFGIDKVQASDMAALYGDMATGMGLTQKAAAELSKDLVGLTGDVASFKNLPHKQVQTALAGIFTGETESLKRLGVVMTQENLNSFLLSKGINKNIKDLNQMQRVMLRSEYVTQVLNNSSGDFLRTADGYANSLRVVRGAVKEIGVTFGNILMPVLAKIFQRLTGVIRMFQKFAESPAGKFVLKLTLAIGGLLIALGTLTFAVNAARFSIFKMAGALGEATRKTVMTTIAQKGMRAGLFALGRAAWAALGPIGLIIGAVLLAFTAFRKAIKMFDSSDHRVRALGATLLVLAGPLGWITLAFKSLMKGVKAFDDLMAGGKVESGFLGWLQKVGGLIRGVMALWTSFDPETGQSEISKALWDSLGRLGLQEIFLNLSTWVGRIKMLFIGIGEGFDAALQFIKDGLLAIGEWLAPVFDKLEEWGIWVNKNESEMEKWKQAGKALGLVIVGGLVAMTVAMVGFATTTLIMMAPVLLAVGLLVAIIYGVYKAIQAVKKGWADLVSWWTSTKDIGAKLMDNLIAGIKNKWQELKTWFKNAMLQLAGELGGVLGKVWDFFGGEGSIEAGGSGGVSPGAAVQTIAANNASAAALAGINRSSIVNNTTNNTPQPVNLVLQMDGDPVFQKLLDQQALNNARDTGR